LNSRGNEYGYLHCVKIISEIAKDKVCEKCYFICFHHRTEERQFWIGFNKRNTLSGGTWQWSDRTPVNICVLYTSATIQVISEQKFAKMSLVSKPWPGKLFGFHVCILHLK